jgi:membrane peptidoglycan carboxypeptidase
LRPDTTTSAWFVGYTPQLAAAVDFYKGTGKADLDGVGGLSTFFGGEYPARIWTAFMQAAMQGKEVKDFPPAAYVGDTVNPPPPPKPSPTETESETPSEAPSPTPTPTDTATVPPSEPPPSETPPPSPADQTVSLAPDSG